MTFNRPIPHRTGPFDTSHLGPYHLHLLAMTGLRRSEAVR